MAGSASRILAMEWLATESPSDALTTTELGPFLAGDRLDPAEGFLDPRSA
jgi:hypothetical protein